MLIFPLKSRLSQHVPFTQKVSFPIIEKMPYDLTSNAGLALVGQYMKRLEIRKRVDRKFPVGVAGIADRDILKS